MGRYKLALVLYQYTQNKHKQATTNSSVSHITVPLHNRFHIYHHGAPLESKIIPFTYVQPKLNSPWKYEYLKTYCSKSEIPVRHNGCFIYECNLIPQFEL
jgi:hypothetical protein